MKTTDAILDCLSRKSTHSNASARASGKPSARYQLCNIVFHVMQSQLSSADFHWPTTPLERREVLASDRYKRAARVVKAELQSLMAEGKVLRRDADIYGSARYYLPDTQKPAAQRHSLEIVRNVEIAVPINIPPGCKPTPESPREVRVLKDYSVKVPEGYKLDDSEKPNPRVPAYITERYLLDYADELKEKRFIVVVKPPSFEPKFGDVIKIALHGDDAPQYWKPRVFIGKTKDGHFITVDYAETPEAIAQHFAQCSSANYKQYFSAWKYARPMDETHLVKS